MKDSEFKKEWDALETEFSLVQALIDARESSGLTQSELASGATIADFGGAVISDLLAL